MPMMTGKHLPRYTTLLPGIPRSIGMNLLPSVSSVFRHVHSLCYWHFQADAPQQSPAHLSKRLQHRLHHVG